MTPWPGTRWVLAYFTLYAGYLWFVQEGELAHWASLVLLPWGLLWWRARRSDPDVSVREVGRRIGLTWPPAGRGMGLALALAVAIQAIQLLNRAQRHEVLTVLASARNAWVGPAALLLALTTAGFTEEFFFRGIVQRTLHERFRSHTVAVLGASVVFALYHVPYAYLDPSWPSAGDLPHALRLALINGFLAGVPLGIVFVRARSSLVPCILVHAAVDWMPAVRLLAG